MNRTKYIWSSFVTIPTAISSGSRNKNNTRKNENNKKKNEKIRKIIQQCFSYEAKNYPAVDEISACFGTLNFMIVFTKGRMKPV